MCDEVDCDALIVDDDPDVRELIAHYADGSGLVIDYASSGEEALQLTAKKRYQTYLVDLNLPVLDGLGVIKDIMQRESVSKIIMLTGHDEEHPLWLQAVRLGITKAFSKPVNYAVIVQYCVDRKQRALAV